MDLSFTIGRTGRPFFVSIRPNAISVMADETSVYTFDRAGRLSTAVVEDRTYRRGLSNRVLCKWREGTGEDRQIRRHWLPEAEVQHLLDRVTGDVREALTALERNEFVSKSLPCERHLVESLLPWLGKAAACDFEALQQEGARVNRIYRPVTILPPDQYLSLVLQATEGCHYNRCSFCSFYRERPFRVKSLVEFRQHMTDVLELLGDGVTIRRSVFLADANAVCIPSSELLPLLDAVNESLPVRSQFGEVSPSGFCLDGIYSFVDAFSGHNGAVPDYAGLWKRNVRRLYLGIESGSNQLLRFLRKPQTAEDAKETVLAIKAGGLNVGVILMLGIGGTRFAERHVDESIALLDSLPWSKGDFVFLSPFIEFAGSEYTEIARQAGIEGLSEIQLARQYAAIRQGISRGGGNPVIAPYNAEEFIY